MPRKKRPLDRDGGVLRDASLVVIASEDTYAVRQYFARFRPRRVQFVVLPTEGGRSSPDAVMMRLDNFKTRYEIGDGDQFWVCIDTDHWVQSNHIPNLTLVLRQCRQKQYFVAISNPCFELWLLLHFRDVEATATRTAEQVIDSLSRECGGYKKHRCEKLALSGQMVHDAVRRAKSLDSDSSEIPETLSTRVYRIIEQLLARDSIELL